MCVGAHMPLCTWSEDNLQELPLSFFHGCAKSQTQVLGAGQPVPLPSHLSGPVSEIGDLIHPSRQEEVKEKLNSTIEI